ncbi:hypothetical protein SADUNF_Sadunf09G0103200 [Salix dunnii]|uniref:Uncharacterized protein n=1 Tax=Salix dunnii TaxID=1413687 RepID=A0A835MSM0_9ROSI|nr:hypothetical protein SADUNF_Sadunf09G0103200 [Salix dunnii]
MAPPPGPYSGTSTLALVARVSAFSFGLVYGSVKLKYLQVASMFMSNVLMKAGQKTSYATWRMMPLCLIVTTLMFSGKFPAG